MKSKLFGVLAAVVMALGLVTPSASAAGVVMTSFYAYGTDTPKMCLDGYVTMDAYVNKCNAGNFQNFYWNNTPGIKTPIRSVGEDNRCLQPNGDKEVKLRTCDENNGWQRWNVNFPADGGPAFIKHPSMDLCLTRDGSPHVTVILKPCTNGQVAQRWVPIK